MVTAQTKGKHFSTHDNSVKQLRRVESFVVDGSWGVLFKKVVYSDVGLLL